MKLPLTQANYMLQSKRAMYGYVEIRPLDTFCPVINTVMKKEETQTLRAGCSKAEPNFFAPPQTPSRGRETAKI